ncbi:MAG: hypothetical protein H0X33_04145 [Taibaiella sp.]|nr:hypothetical protein [Taibaiella sp.]
MKNYLFSVAVILLLLVSCTMGKGRHSEKLSGVWQPVPITIDGDSKDWPLPYPSYDAKAMIGYAYSNDKDNLYLTVETGDEMTQLKMLKAGFTVSIDTSGGKGQTVNIHYPLPGDSDPLDMPFVKGKKHDDDMTISKPQVQTKESILRRLNSALGHATQMSLGGFNKCDGTFLVQQQNNCGIKVKAAIDEYNELIWEIAIPFKGFYKRAQLDPSDVGKAISVCFAIKGFKHPSTSDNTSGAGMGNGGMGGGMHSNAMAGGGARGGGGPMRSAPGNNPREHLYESTKTWKTFGLTYQ